jgi:hypothetical protein
MAIVLNFEDFTYSIGSGKGSINSPEELYDLCQPPQLNRFAENILGKRFPRGTKKLPACEELFEAMLEGENATETEKKEETVTKGKDKGGRKASTVGKKPADKKKPATKKPDTEEKPKTKTKKEKTLIEYVITKGETLPEKYQVTANREVTVTNIPIAITKGILKILGRKKSMITTIPEIMENAETTNEWAEKPSNMETKSLFAWWAKLLRETGWVIRQKAA